MTAGQDQLDAAAKVRVAELSTVTPPVVTPPLTTVFSRQDLVDNMWGPTGTQIMPNGFPYHEIHPLPYVWPVMNWAQGAVHMIEPGDPDFINSNGNEWNAWGHLFPVPGGEHNYVLKQSVTHWFYQTPDKAWHEIFPATADHKGMWSTNVTSTATAPFRMFPNTGNDMGWTSQDANGIYTCDVSKMTANASTFGHWAPNTADTRLTIPENAIAGSIQCSMMIVPKPGANPTNIKDLIGYTGDAFTNVHDNRAYKDAAILHPVYRSRPINKWFLAGMITNYLKADILTSNVPIISPPAS